MTNQSDGWSPGPGGFGSEEYREAQEGMNQLCRHYLASMPLTFATRPELKHNGPMDPQDLVSTLSKVITKRFIQVGFWLFAVAIAVGFGGKALGFW